MTQDNPTSESANGKHRSNRRKFLGSTAAFGLASLMGNAQAGQNSKQSQRRGSGGPPWAPKEHDHSGEYNTSTRLGEEAPVESIVARESYTTQYPEINVDAFGAAGDGETDDTSAIQSAANSPKEGESGILSFSGGKDYYVPGTISINASKIRGIEGNNASLITDNTNTVLQYQGTFTGSASPDSGNVPEIADEELGPYIENLQIYNNGSYSYTESPYEGTGIEVERAFNLNISGCHIFRMGTGIRFVERSRNINLIGNKIYDNRPYGIHFSGVSIHQINTVSNIITYAVDPIYLSDSAIYNLQLSGNDIEVSSTGSKSCIRAEGGTVQEWEVNGNTIQGHSDVPTLINLTPGDAQYVSITGNHISNCSENAIYMDAGNSDFEGIIVSDNTAKSLGGHFVNMTGQDFPLFRMAGNSIDGGLGLKAAITTNAGPLQVSGNIIAPNEHNDPVIDVSGRRGLRSIKVVNNTIYPGSTNQDGDEWMISITTPGDAESVILTENQVFTRGGDRSGLQISSENGNYSGIIAKNNIAREINSSAAAFDFPNEEQGSVAIADNMNIP